MEIKRIFEVKKNGKWVEEFTNTDPVEVTRHPNPYKVQRLYFMY